MRKRLGADRWRELLSEFDSNDSTVADFCDSMEVSVQTFYKWRKKLQPDGARITGSSTPTSGFVSVALATPPLLQAQLEIELPCGAVARVPNDCVSIRPLIEVLLDLGGQS